MLFQIKKPIAQFLYETLEDLPKLFYDNFFWPEILEGVKAILKLIKKKTYRSKRTEFPAAKLTLDFHWNMGCSSFMAVERSLACKRKSLKLMSYFSNSYVQAYDGEKSIIIVDGL